MAAELGLTISSHSEKFAQRQLRYTTCSSTLMWNNKQQMAVGDDESWEVRAFEEDTTGNLMGCTWPPRSYTCTFCRREFRSAQALGGHMNVHRRDRARLHHDAPPASQPIKSQPPPSPIVIPTHDIVTNGLCLIYAVPNPNSILIIPPPVSTVSATNEPTTAHSNTSLQRHSSETELSLSNSNDNNFLCSSDTNVKDSSIEELDLELRLGRKSP